MPRLERAGRTARLLGILTTPLIRALDDIWLLVTLIDLYAEDRRRGRWLLCLLLLYGTHGRPRRSYGRGTAFVQTPGIGCVHGVRMGVERVAQRELNLAFGLGKGNSFGVFG